MAAAPPVQNDTKLVRSLQGSRDVKFTACKIVPGRKQVATGTQDGSLLLWPLAPGRPRPLRFGGQQGGQLTCVAASPSGSILATSSTDATVAVWRSRIERHQVPLVLKVHFSPVRSCDISADERLLLSASDDKSVKLCSLPERRFFASFLGHSNWVRSAVFSNSSNLIVSGGDDKTVRLWDTEQKSCVRVWHDCGASVSCVRFGLSEGAVAASTVDSSINIWDVRSHALRQHYGRAHGGSPIHEVAFRPGADLLLSSSADRQLRIWDLRAGRLRSTIAGHDRPVLACCWDDTGENFASCDSELVNVWSCELSATPACTGAEERVSSVDDTLESTEPMSTRSGILQEKARFEAHVPAVRCSVSPVQPSSNLGNMLEAAWAGGQSMASPCGLKTRRHSTQAIRHEMLPESAARLTEQLVSKMEGLTRALESLESRLARTEAVTAEVAELMQTQRLSGHSHVVKGSFGQMVGVSPTDFVY
eukprot:TRINITY_DN25561_c0_g1_i1.p1 TRINITY_DN25561_c0_g1~~TRINITY_DN25561_c0_g1_i1.p1  ORF type:complete len:477 (-),score=47.81 TRINITY_DN25561_c0_g1_i1:43-1473(-)